MKAERLLWMVATIAVVYVPMAAADFPNFGICTEAGAQRCPDVSGNIVVWEDERSGDQDIYWKDLTDGVETPLARWRRGGGTARQSTAIWLSGWARFRPVAAGASSTSTFRAARGGRLGPCLMRPSPIRSTRA